MDMTENSIPPDMNASKKSDAAKSSAFAKATIPCRVSFQLKYLITLCLVVLLFTLAFHSVTSIWASDRLLSPVMTPRDAIAIRFLMKKLESVRDCVLRESRRFNGVVWRKLHIIITTCATNSAFSELRYSYIYSKTDKSFLPFRTQPVRSCTVVTLGVGNEVTYETNLQQKYPSCRFYGADPYPETGEVFKKVGKIFYTAIDNVTSTADNLWVLRNGSYGWQNGVRVTSLGEFIRDMAQVKLVHYMSMDVEGAEYRIIPYVTKGDFEVESGNAVICQISAEFHGPLKDFNISMTEFESMWTKLISDSPYVPLRAYPPGNHHRFNLFNAKNEDCVRMFLL